MAGSDFIVGYLFGRRGGLTGWRGRERTRPKMPAGSWRLAAVLCITAGAIAAWLSFGQSGNLGWRMVGGGAIGFVVGMYVVESVWERRQYARNDVPSTPIGRRT